MRCKELKVYRMLSAHTRELVVDESHELKRENVIANTCTCRRTPSLWQFCNAISLVLFILQDIGLFQLNKCWSRLRRNMLLAAVIILLKSTEKIYFCAHMRLKIFWSLFAKLLPSVSLCTVRKNFCRGYANYHSPCSFDVNFHSC